MDFWESFSLVLGVESAGSFNDGEVYQLTYTLKAYAQVF
jgi:hypothetical protein